MPRPLLVSILVLGLILPGCATPPSAARPTVAPGESVCWDPPPEKPAHPVRDWCKAHPWTVGICTGLLVVGGIVAGGAVALQHSGAGAAIVMAGMH